MVFVLLTKTLHKKGPGEGSSSVTPIKMRVFVMATKIKFVWKIR